MRISKSTLALCVVAGVSAVDVAAEEKPNIIWIMAEDMGQDLACYGMKGVKTPVLDKMASEGILFTNACCSNPISSPSRSAMMTGVHQNIINAHNHRSNRDIPLSRDVQPITYHLRDAGYTCLLGNDDVMNKGTKTDCNFKHTAVGEWNGVDKFGLFDKRANFTKSHQPFFNQIQLVVTHRGDWWRSVSEKSAHRVDTCDIELPPYMEDHPQIRKEWASYLDQVEYMDNEVGLILQQLEDTGVIDNTIVVFIADNGRCNIKGKGYLYEPGIKIPMIVWGKGIKPAVVDDIVSTLDISATILDLAGASMPSYLSGKPIIKDGEPKVEQGSFYAARDTWDEIVDCMRSIKNKEYSYIRNYVTDEGWDRHQHYLDFNRPALHVMRMLKEEGRLSQEASIFLASTKPKEELYDLKSDPHEMNNLADDPNYAAIKEQMSTEMDRWQAKYKDMGLLDLNSRKVDFTEKDDLRIWLQQNNPEAWENIKRGEMVESYKKWKSQSSIPKIKNTKTK